jgi:hypothetical protein
MVLTGGTTMSMAKDVWKYVEKKIPRDAESAVLQQFWMDNLFKGEKFVLPDDAVLMDDPQCRGLDLDEPLQLPFDTLVLEFKTPAWAKLDTSKFLASSKTVVIVTTDLRPIKKIKAAPGWMEYHRPVYVSSWVFMVKEHRWSRADTFLMPTNHWNEGRYEGGSVKHKVFKISRGGLHRVNQSIVESFADPGETETPVGLEAVVELLNMLACSNVAMHKTRTDKVKEGKPPLPFSETWELTIDSPTKPSGSGGEGLGGSHRSPREHIRRGHIRRYESGKKIWVNAAIISAGTVGKITKTYKVDSMQSIANKV